MSDYAENEDRTEEAAQIPGDATNQSAQDQSPKPNDPAQDASDEALLARETQPADIPIANVLRIMKSSLPSNAKIAKEAKECVQECISEFIAFITSEASEKCMQEKRKTVNGEDVLFAMTSLGFENYGEALKIYLTKYREQNKPHESGSSALAQTSKREGGYTETDLVVPGQDEEEDEEEDEDEDEEGEGGARAVGGSVVPKARGTAIPGLSRKRKGSSELPDNDRPHPVPVLQD